MSTHVCLNCSATIKGGLLANPVVAGTEIAYVNALGGFKLESACEKCFPELRLTTEAAFKEKVAVAREVLRKVSLTIPVASIQTPPGWDFEVIGIVTAQSVTGTGLFSDVTSAFTDLFGAQSNSYSQKLRAGENVCKASLRAQAVERSANAIVGVDVDYAEVGGQRAMLMVCMTGTAVRLRNPEAVAPDFVDKLKSLEANHRDLVGLLDTATKYRLHLS